MAKGRTSLLGSNLVLRSMRERAMSSAIALIRHNTASPSSMDANWHGMFRSSIGRCGALVLLGG